MAKLSKNEKKAKELGISLKEYKAQKKSKSSSSSGDYGDILDSILNNTPAQQEVLPAFEDTYSSDLQAEDYAQSEALYKPYFEQQIANELEDLNAWSATEGTNYERSLRRARFSLASQGGAIGNERATQEGEMQQDYETNVANKVRSVERTVGTEKVVGAGYKNSGQTQEGSIVGQMKAAIQEGQLWYKNQRAQRYYGNANTYYTQPTNYSLAGTEM